MSVSIRDENKVKYSYLGASTVLRERKQYLMDDVCLRPFRREYSHWKMEHLCASESEPVLSAF